MSIRACLETDLPVDGAPWLVPDIDLDVGRSLVEESDGRIVAAGLLRWSRVSAGLGQVELFCREGHGTDVLRAFAADEHRPMLLRVLPGTPTAAAVRPARGPRPRGPERAGRSCTHRAPGCAHLGSDPAGRGRAGGHPAPSGQ